MLPILPFLVAMDCLALAVELLEVPEVFELKATCRAATSLPGISQRTTQAAWREHHETVALRTNDMDAPRDGIPLSIQETPRSPTPSLGFSIDSDGHWREHEDDTFWATPF